VACALLVGVVAAAAPARADEAPTRQRMRFSERSGAVRVTTTINKLFDAPAYEALGSGFESTVVLRVWVYPRGGGEPVAFQALERKLIYDMWAEQFQLQLDGPEGRRTVEVKQQAEAFTLLTSLAGVPVVETAALPYDEQFVLVLVAELNPVSPETLAEVRRWLTRGSGGGLDRGGGLFGSMVSVFVNPRVADADRVLRLRSQPFFRPRP
jgi:hypothetical protein